MVFGLPSVRLGRLFGIPLEVDASWLFIFFLVSSSLTLSYFPEALPGREPVLYIVLGVLTALAFFASLVLHEIAHSLVARAGGLKISKVTLFMLGGVSEMDEEPRSPGHEFLLAIAGPAMSVVLGIGLLASRAVLISAGVPAAWWLPLEYLGLINLALAAFNLLPGFPLDGGRVLRAILWALTGDVLRATRWASRSGQAIGLMLIAVAVFGVLQGMFNLVWLAVMGWFLTSIAAGAYHQQVLMATMAQVSLGAVMSSPAVLAPADLSLEEMAHTYFLGGRHTRYPVVDGDHVIGLIDLSRANAVPRSAWPDTRVREVAAADLASIVASPDQSIASVLPRLEPDGPGAILVVQDGRLAGIVTRSDVIRFIRESSRHS